MPVWRGWGSLTRTGVFGGGFMVAPLCLIRKLQSSKNDDHHPVGSRDEPAQPDGVLHVHPSPRLERSDVPNRGFAPRVAVFFRKTTLRGSRFRPVRLGG